MQTMRTAALTPRCAPARGAPAVRRGSVRASAAPPASTSVKIADAAKATVQGTSRKVNEDRSVLEPTGTAAAFSTYAAVFDGHGGSATADWLVSNLAKIIDKGWNPASPEKSVSDAFLAADRRLLAPGGLLGMGERGVGGSKCGSTAAVAGIVAGGAGGAPTLLAAGVGDARVLLIRPDGRVTQLTTDHVPDADEERERIERTNPNPKMPLVRWVGGTWRAGGILALSRAFGDAYMKGSLQFEGISAGSDGYSSGFGVIAQPDITLTALAPGEDAWVVVASDGLFANVERGGGGGLSNEEVAAIVAQVGPASGAAAVGAALTAAAQAAGSTDDVTVVAVRVVV